MVHKFSATLKAHGGMDATYVEVPLAVEKLFGTKGMVKVKATFDGHPYRGVLSNMGMGCHTILVRKDIRKAIGKTAGEKIQVTIEKDEAERTVDMPRELSQLLKNSPKAKSIFEKLSYTNRKEFAVWITSAKQTETRDRRLSQVIPKLLKGKRNPFEK